MLIQLFENDRSSRSPHPLQQVFQELVNALTGGLVLYVVELSPLENLQDFSAQLGSVDAGEVELDGVVAVDLLPLHEVNQKGQFFDLLVAQSA